MQNMWFLIHLKKLWPLLGFLLAISQVSAREVEDAVTVISLKAIPGLQYDLVRFKVKPGEKIQLVLTNTDDMGHNLLITRPDARLAVVNAAMQLGGQGPAMDYIPDSPDVLCSIPVTYKGETKSVTFTAPKEMGAYPYVCTYPGHGFVMYGVMYVTADDAWPDIKNDMNIPDSRRQDEQALMKGGQREGAQHVHNPLPLHPYQRVPPYLYRVFIEGASLAAIAVHLPQEFSYCWDAGTCHLRFAWEGDFLDNTALWHGHKNAYAEVMGTVFFRDKTTYPLRTGKADNIPEAEYKGYRLINRYPEFHYTLNGMDVYELIKPKADGSGLIRTFRIPDAKDTLWFVYHPGDGVDYKCSKGQWENGQLRLSPQQAKTFTLTMTKTGKIP